ncbi:MAG: DUF6912 family protein [Actinocrinis sp.]
MRVYIPATLPILSELAKRGELGPGPITAYAVTPALREWYVEGDEEELEFAAMNEAARGALRLLAADRLAPRRRVVVAAELFDAVVTLVGTPVSRDRGLDPGQVRVDGVVALRDVASFHVDDTGAEPAVGEAALVVAAADAGDDDARFTVDGAEDYDLLWFATQELSHLLDDRL